MIMQPTLDKSSEMVKKECWLGKMGAGYLFNMGDFLGGGDP